MSRSRVRGSAAGLVTILVFVLMALALKPGQRGSSGQPSDKPKPRPAGEPISVPANLAALTVSLGLKDQKATDWDGAISVSEGKVLSVDILQGNPKASAGPTSFTVKSTVGKKPKKAALSRPVIRVSVDAPRSAKIEFKTKQGGFTVPLADLEPGMPRHFLNDQVSVVMEDGALRLTGEETEDDYPVLARAPDGTIWLAYIEYQKSKGYVTERVLAGNFDELVPKGHGDQIRLKKFDGKTWSPAIDATDTGLTLWRPTVAVDKNGAVHVAWAQQQGGDWDIYHRSYQPADNKWSPIARLTIDKGNNFHVVAAADSVGNVWLAWQSWQPDEKRFAINYMSVSVPTEGKKAGVAPGQRKAIQASGNSWTPAIAADSKGNVYIAYDTYEKGSYDVWLVGTAARKDGHRGYKIAGSARFEARPSIVCDAQDRVWIAYEEGDEQWGKDYSTNQFRKIGFEENPGYDLYNHRTVKVKCLVDGKLQQPAADLEKALKGKLDRQHSHPRLAIDKAGGLWLMVRHHPLALGAGEVWNSYVLQCSGNAWSVPRRLSASANLLDNRPGLVPFGDGIVTVYSGDRTTNTLTRTQNDLFATVLRPSGRASAPPAVVADTPVAKNEMKDVHPREAEHVARIRAYTIPAEGKKLRLFRGEFHRHTEYTAHRDQDGSLEDSWRYSLDAAGMDWMGNGDHDNGQHHEYPWWQIQKMTELMNHPPHFVAAHTHERSVKYPDGHRNVIMPKSGVRPLPRGSLDGTEQKGTPDTKMLYRYLHHFGAMCSSHTSGTGMGTDWRDNDPVVEPVVEIYQGHRHNYEHFGAPRSATKDTNIGGYEPKGFVWNAFEKGYKLGFQASSDHVSTHMSYAVVLTDDLSAKGIIDAFKKRHSYAATDNIIVDVRCGKQIMGDIFETKDRPTLDIVVHGTAPIAKLHIVRSNKYVYSDAPKKADAKLRYTDADAQPGQSYFYYVRIEQTDGNLAWSSPMWITYRK
jgi:hypothetical protein